MVAPLFDPAGFGGMASAIGKLSKAIEFWRGYKGRRVTIISSTLTNKGLHKYMIEGEIEDVVSYPPAFKLSNVDEWIYHHYYEDPTPAVPTTKTKKDLVKVNSVEEKIVALSSADQVEFANDNGGDEEE